MRSMQAPVGKRVLMLLENNPYPQDGRVRREANVLVGAGYRVTVIAPAGPKQPWRDIINGVRVYRYPRPPEGEGLIGYLWEYGYSLVAACLLSLFLFFYDDFDIIHAHNPPDTFVLLAAGYKPLGKRFVFDHHDLSPEMYYARFRGEGNKMVYQALLLLEQLTFRLSDHVIATNQSYKAIATQRGGVPESRVTIVRNGPDLNRVRTADPDPALRQKAPIIIGYVGEMGYHDGVDYLLRAIKHLIDDVGRTDFYCVLVGQGDAWPELQELKTELGLDDYVWFPGFVSDAELMSYLSTADICVDPDPSNPFTDRSTMIKMAEFMALGKPIVAFDLTEHRFTAQDAAIYARANDELDFARNIALLMDDPERRAQMARIGKERIQTQLAWQHQEHCLIEAYDKITGHTT
ncbi:MAG: glycosyltransferase family 4 protein [Chloroflexaceae bacterium]|nr:glycosyltransferase family 4 protein [Chloroflexaceae bacterium]